MTEQERRSFTWLPRFLHLLNDQKEAATAAAYPATPEQAERLRLANSALTAYCLQIGRDEFDRLIALLYRGVAP